MNGFRAHKLVVIDTEYTGSCKSNYHTIITTTAPVRIKVWVNIWLWSGYKYSQILLCRIRVDHQFFFELDEYLGKLIYLTFM